MTRSDGVLIAMWAAYLMFVGPFLISRPSYEEPAAGFLLLAALLWFSWNRVKPIIQRLKENAR